jgi:non-ribosomal peptide synthetase component F
MKEILIFNRFLLEDEFMFQHRQSTETGIAAGQSLQEREYWLTQLAGEWTRTRFYYDYREAGKQEYKPGTVTFKFSGELLPRLMKVIKGSDAKLHMILVTELVLLLGKYTGKDDIIIGSPIYRQKVEGEFINTLLPLRNRLEDNMTFKELLLQVRQTIHEAVKNQNYPMDKLIYEMGLPDSDNWFPLFEVVVLLENIHDRRYIAHIPAGMIFSFLRTGETVEGKLEYDSSLYAKETGERIAAHFSNLLDKTLFDVDVRLSAVDVFAGEEKKKLLFDFNGTDAEYPADKTLHELFADRAEKSGDGTAVVCVEQCVGAAPRGRPGMAAQHLTYGELNRKSGQLARLLREEGVGADTLVGIMMGPSLEMAAAIFAVLKAGGAYLPIDPGYPRERIDYMLADSGARVLLKKSEIRISKSETNSNDQNSNDQNKISTSIVLNLEHLNFEFVSNFEFRASNLDSLNLAYVIYTSGSTGKPKGVLIEHRNILNYVFWRIDEYGQTSSDISLQLVSFSFDGFCANFYPTLLSGGIVVFIGPGYRLYTQRNQRRRRYRFQCGAVHVQGVVGWG